MGTCLNSPCNPRSTATVDTPRPKLPVLARLTAFLPWMCANSEEVLAAPEDPAANRGMADKMLSQVLGVGERRSLLCSGRYYLPCTGFPSVPG